MDFTVSENIVVDEIKEVRMRDWVCFGADGIPRNPASPDCFGCISIDRTISIFNPVQGRLLRFSGVDFSHNLDSQIWDSSTEFNKNGKLFLVSSITVHGGKTVSVFDSKSFKLLQKWHFHNIQLHLKAKWLGNSAFIVVLEDSLVLIKLGSKKPEAVFSFKMQMANDFIQLFEISQDKNQLILGTSSTFSVSKAKINLNDFDRSLSKEEKASENGGVSIEKTKKELEVGLEWSHQCHKDTINVIEISEDGKHVFSGGDERRVVMAETGSGRVLSIFEGFSNCIYGVFCGNRRNESDFLVICSESEVKVAHIDQKSKGKMGKTIIKVNENLSRDVGFLGCNVSKGLSSKESEKLKNYLVLGDSNGRLFRIDFDEMLGDRNRKNKETL